MHNHHRYRGRGMELVPGSYEYMDTQANFFFSCVHLQFLVKVHQAPIHDTAATQCTRRSPGEQFHNSTHVFEAANG